MPRKKIENKDKKVSFGITIHPELDKLLEEQSNKNNISKSQLIENIMVEYLKNNDNNK
jgi:hypothetical protein